MDRARLRLLLVVASAVVAAVVAALALRPRGGLVEPLPVDLRSYFSAAELDRARDFRRPQALLGLAALALQAALLAALVWRPPRLLPRGAFAAGAFVALALTVVVLPLRAVMRSRSLDVGLATQSWPAWAGDVAKGAAISALLAGFGAVFAMGLARRFGSRWWLPGAVGVFAAAAALVYAGPVVLDPVFNRFTELPAGETRRDVLALARRAGVDVGDVLVMDASRRTSAANAYVTGLGSTKRVVLYDTLLGGGGREEEGRGFTREETRLVVAHELGHVRHRDVPRGLLFVALVAPLGMLAVARLGHAWTGGDPRRRIPALALALGVVATPVGWAGNALSRAVEARADAYALRLTGDGPAFVDFERRIALRNVSDPAPPEALHLLFGTHPTIARRIGAGEAFSRSRRPGPRRTPAGS